MLDTGCPKWGVLVKLKNSPRNWTRVASESTPSLKFLRTPKSQLVRVGPVMMLAPLFPKVNGKGTANCNSDTGGLWRGEFGQETAWQGEPGGDDGSFALGGEAHRGNAAIKNARQRTGIIGMRGPQEKEGTRRRGGCLGLNLHARAFGERSVSPISMSMPRALYGGLAFCKR